MTENLKEDEVKVSPLLQCLAKPSNVITLGHRDSAISLFFNLDNEMSYLISNTAPEHDVETIDEAVEYAEDLIYNLKELKKEIESGQQQEVKSVDTFSFEHEGSFSIDFNPWIIGGVIMTLAAAYVLGAYIRHLIGV